MDLERSERLNDISHYVGRYERLKKPTLLGRETSVSAFNTIFCFHLDVECGQRPRIQHTKIRLGIEKGYTWEGVRGSLVFEGCLSLRW